VTGRSKPLGGLGFSLRMDVGEGCGSSYQWRTKRYALAAELRTERRFLRPKCDWQTFVLVSLASTRWELETAWTGARWLAHDVYNDCCGKKAPLAACFNREAMHP